MSLRGSGREFPGDREGIALDNDQGEDAPVGRRLALGLSKFLVGFAERRNAQIWTEFARATPLRGRFTLQELADDPSTTIGFNLNRWTSEAGLTRAATGRATPTDRGVVPDPRARSPVAEDRVVE